MSPPAILPCHFCAPYSRLHLPLSLQVSWLGLEENADDPCKFTLTSRSSGGTLERYTLHSTSPGVSQVWVHQVSQILENQRNFLNGKRVMCTLTAKRLFIWWKCTQEILCWSFDNCNRAISSSESQNKTMSFFHSVWN